MSLPRSPPLETKFSRLKETISRDFSRTPPLHNARANIGFDFATNALHRLTPFTRSAIPISTPRWRRGRRHARPAERRPAAVVPARLLQEHLHGRAVPLHPCGAPSEGEDATVWYTESARVTGGRASAARPAVMVTVSVMVMGDRHVHGDPAATTTPPPRTRGW